MTRSGVSARRPITRSTSWAAGSWALTQDLFEDSTDSTPMDEAAMARAREMYARYPNVTELALAATHDGALGACDDEFEFQFGLDLVLDGLERRLA